MKTKIITLAIVTCCWACLNQAQAVPVIIEITGNVTSASGSGLPGTIYAGVSFSGTYTYDSATPDSDPSVHRGEYQQNPPYDISIVLGGYEFKIAPKLVIMDDDATNGLKDCYIVFTGEDFTVPSAGLTIDYIRWALWDSSHTALSSDTLPITAPVLTKWDYNVLDIYGFDSLGYGISIYGRVTQAVLVPEPATITLLLTASVFLLRRRR